MTSIVVSEKFCKIINETDQSFLSKLDKHLSFKYEGAEFTPAFKAHKWDGREYLLSSKLVFYTGLLDFVIEFFKSNDKQFDIIDERKPFEFSSIDITENLKKLNITPYDYQLSAIDVALKHNKAIFKNATGSGKCSHVNSLHITEHGLLDYEELLEYIKPEVNTYTPFKSQVSTPLKEQEFATEIYYDGYSSSKEIKTNYGFELTATPKHQIKVIDENGNMVWKSFADVKIGDYTVICPGTNLFGKDEISLDDAYWYGLLMGDGGMSRREGLTLTNMDKYILDFGEKYLSERNIKYLFVSKKSESKAKDIIVNNVEYREKLRKFGFKICKSTSKEIPASIRRLSKKSLAMFIRGLYETDGWINKSDNAPGICIGLSTKKAIDQLHLILLNYGIVASRRVKKTYREDSHILTIYKDYIDIFMKEIGFTPGGRKFDELNNELKKYNASVSNTNTNIVPNQKNNLTKLLEPFLFKRHFFKNCPIKRRTLHSWAKGKRNPSKDNLKEFLLWFSTKVKDDEIIHTINDMLSLCVDKLFFTQIKSIKDVMSENYDFVVPETNSFVSQGFVNHNTATTSLITAKLNKPTVIYVISKELLYQFHDFFSKVFNETIGIIGDGLCDIQRISIASIWTVGKAIGMKKSEILLSDDEDEEAYNESNSVKITEYLKTVDVHHFDECHVAAAKTVRNIYKIINPKKIFGWSGTPYRDDGAGMLLTGILGDVQHEVSASELIKRKILAKPIIKFVKIQGQAGFKQTYQSVYAENVVNNYYRNNVIVNETKKLLDKNYQVLVLFKTIKHGKNIKQIFEEKNIDCEFLTGFDKTEDRELVKQNLLSGKSRCILASMIYDIGIDIPTLNGLVLGGSGKSCVKTLQRIGRVIRDGKNKPYAAVVEFYDDVKFLKKHSLVRKSLYETEPEFEIHFKINDDKKR